jgi:hypothetical protein
MSSARVHLHPQDVRRPRFAPLFHQIFKEGDPQQHLRTGRLVPDAPVTKFTLTMQGGSKGLLVNSTNICKSTNRATVLLDAQNGKTADSNPVVKADCGKGKHHKASKRHHH